MSVILIQGVLPSFGSIVLFDSIAFKVEDNPVRETKDT